MLANRKTVRAFVNCFADMTATGIYRRVWCDKTKAKNNERLLTFRFWDATEADTVAQHLEAVLVAGGYTNKVRRTSVDSDYMTRTAGGEYVRVRVLY